MAACRFLLLPLLLAASMASLSAGEPADEEALAQGWAAYQAGRLEDAAALYQKALDRNPTDRSIQYDLGCLLAQTGKLPQAKMLLSALADQAPNAEVYAALGQVHEQLDDGESAQASLENALQLEPENAKTLWRLSRVLLRMDKPAQAELLLQRLLAIEPTHVEARYHLGELDLRDGQPELAIHEFRQALRQDAAHVMAWNGLAVAYIRVGALDEAQRALDRAALLDPRNLHTRTNAGVLAAARRQWNQARQAWQDVLAQQPDFSPAAENLRTLATVEHRQVNP